MKCAISYIILWLISSSSFRVHIGWVLFLALTGMQG
jgi:hypothetical protein